MWRKPNQADDTLESFEWKPPKDSDELFEALKITFPNGKTQRSRFRDALTRVLVLKCEAERHVNQALPSLRYQTSTGATSDEHVSHKRVSE